MTTSTPAEPEIVEVRATTAASVAAVVAMDALAPFFHDAYSSVAAALAEQGVAIAGPPFALYHGAPAATADVEAGFPTARVLRPIAEVRASALPGGRVVRAIHHGSYDGLGDAWARPRGWMEAHQLEPGREMWEVYLTEPTPETDPATMRTELNWSLA